MPWKKTRVIRGLIPFTTEKLIRKGKKIPWNAYRCAKVHTKKRQHVSYAPYNRYANVTRQYDEVKRFFSLCHVIRSVFLKADLISIYVAKSRGSRLCYWFGKYHGSVIRRLSSPVLHGQKHQQFSINHWRPLHVSRLHEAHFRMFFISMLFCTFSIWAVSDVRQCGVFACNGSWLWCSLEWYHIMTKSMRWEWANWKQIDVKIRHKRHLTGFTMETTTFTVGVKNIATSGIAKLEAYSSENDEMLHEFNCLILFHCRDVQTNPSELPSYKWDKTTFSTIPISTFHSHVKFV